MRIYDRNLQDAALAAVLVPFALPAAASTSTHSAIADLGVDWHKPEQIDLRLEVPALATGVIPDTKTVNYLIETSTTSNFAAVAETILNDQQVGAGGTGVPAYGARVRLPSNCARYLRFTITFGPNTTTGAAVSATPFVYF